MDTHMYICQYCHEEYIPARRYIQKFCCNSCRSSFHRRKKISEKLSISNEDAESISTFDKKEKISAPGIANAAIGAGFVELGKHAFTKPENKPATKGDLRALANMIGRYHKINNMPARNDGALPYFDMFTNNVEYGKTNFNYDKY